MSPDFLRLLSDYDSLIRILICMCTACRLEYAVVAVTEVFTVLIYSENRKISGEGDVGLAAYESRKETQQEEDKKYE